MLILHSGANKYSVYWKILVLMQDFAGFTRMDTVNDRFLG